MIPLPLSVEELISKLLSLSKTEQVSILDSCDSSYSGARYLIAGIRPVNITEFSGPASQIVQDLSNIFASTEYAAVLTLSYDLGADLQSRAKRVRSTSPVDEPPAYLALYDSLIVHDYQTARTFFTGQGDLTRPSEMLLSAEPYQSHPVGKIELSSNFTRDSYIAAVENIREHIRRGDTYQANLTQQLTARLSERNTRQDVFSRLRNDHPAAFSGYISRENSTVVSASPERFFRISNGVITTSPIKGTIRRGATRAEDDQLRSRLSSSAKDRAENTMIVDLLRNDLGRVCKFGSVRVESLCEIEEHPTLFHLVSTISGTLRPEATFADGLRASFPCGSITGAPKIRTMELIDELENRPRGLSMGAIGLSIPTGFTGIDPVIEMSVAIRTMVIRNGNAVFNVGGGVVIDSDAESEYEESLLKAQALIAALGIPFAR